ncbi:hypothetical protein KG091_03980 [Carnobacteriaceae bacterium zg-ZUI78]|nr:hypothetical protein [Carnobacteriaceae bacterium zg-ZUI78]
MKKKLVLASAVALLAVAPLTNSVVNAEEQAIKVVKIYNKEYNMTLEQENEFNPLNYDVLKKQKAYVEATALRENEEKILSEAQEAERAARFYYASTLPKELKKLDEKIARLQKTVDGYERETKLANTLLPGLRSDVATYKSQIAGLEALRPTLEADNEDAKDKLMTYASAAGLHTAAQNNIDTAAALSLLETTINAYNTKIEVATAEINKYAPAETEKHDLEKRLLEAEIKDINSEKAAMQSDALAKLTKAIADLTDAQNASFNAITDQENAYNAFTDSLKKLNVWLVQNGFETVSEAILAPAPQELSAAEKDAVEGKKPAPAEKAGAQAQQGKKVLPKTSAAK